MTTGFVTGNMRNTQDAADPNFYATCYEALPPLLAAEGKRLPKALWEPACGNGALVVPLRNRGYEVTATDLNEYGCPVSITGLDFLSSGAQSVAAQLSVDHGHYGIITNPPFNRAEEFVEIGVSLAPYVAVLCRLAFLESEGRMNWFSRVGLSRVHVIGERLPMMHKYGHEGPKLDKGAMAFCWFIFERSKRVKHQVPLRWVSWKKSVRRFPQRPEDIPPTAKEVLPLFRALSA